MDWPARSPDLNPIEHVWDALGRRIGARHLSPRTLVELRTALLEEWGLLPLDLLQSLQTAECCRHIHRAIMQSFACILLTIFWATILSGHPTTGGQYASASFEQRDIELAFEHSLRVTMEAPCSAPQPRVVPVVHASKLYTPHCTVLHRCSKDTGCCPSRYDRCVPVEKQPVTLHFFTITVDGDKLHEAVEALTFQNHTKCACVHYKEVTTENLIE
ncbi:hypothetical protein LAZ67_16000727 [Cordylochernes scorpioides]|uniref:Platelet-derived growth factor (PDGF) family profile domain-containing protein n=1 Tax=Cordylochernes scorpioides TaxID=51811 RepID=A0ABY6LB47_9ARAC|nr:hypothetical protein LAZ67_16000727 [Cordylochernes scorpioides]